MLLWLALVACDGDADDSDSPTLNVVLNHHRHYCSDLAEHSIEIGDSAMFSVEQCEAASARCEPSQNAFRHNDAVTYACEYEGGWVDVKWVELEPGTLTEDGR